MPKNKPAHFYKRKDRKRSPRFKDWIILFLAFVVVVYALSLARHLSLKQAQGKQEPVYVRTQILNGCGENGLAEKIRDKLISEEWEGLVFDVLEVSDFKDSNIAHTLVLDRKGNSRIPYEVASVLGIKRENVLLKKLEDNYLDIDVAIVLGADYSQTEIKSKKELKK